MLSCVHAGIAAIVADAHLQDCGFELQIALLTLVESLAMRFWQSKVESSAEFTKEAKRPKAKSAEFAKEAKRRKAKSAEFTNEAKRRKAKLVGCLRYAPPF